MAAVGISFVLVFILAEALVRIFGVSANVATLRERSLQYHPAFIVRHTLKPQQIVRPDSNRLWHIKELKREKKKPQTVIEQTSALAP